MKPILLHTEQLTVGYRKKALIPDITFSVQAGQILTLMLESRNFLQSPIAILQNPCPF